MSDDNKTMTFRGRRSKVDPFAEEVGVLSDAEVADKAGVTVENVRTWRKRRGIPPASAAGSTPTKARKKGRKKPLRRKSKLDPFRKELGVTTDKNIAERAGVSVENVRAYRKRHGIEANWQKPAEPETKVAAALEAAPKAATPAPPPAATPAARSSRSSAGSPASARRWAYRITADIGGESREYIAFGADVVEAAQVSRDRLRSGDAEATIQKIEVIGVAL